MEILMYITKKKKKLFRLAGPGGGQRKGKRVVLGSNYRSCAIQCGGIVPPNVYINCVIVTLMAGKLC